MSTVHHLPRRLMRNNAGHRQNVNGVDTVFPVNALAFHPVYVPATSFMLPPDVTSLQTRNICNRRWRWFSSDLGLVRKKAATTATQVPLQCFSSRLQLRRYQTCRGRFSVPRRGDRQRGYAECTVDKRRSAQRVQGASSILSAQRLLPLKT